MSCHTSISIQSLLTLLQGKETLKLWRDCNTEGLEQQFEQNGLPFWSPQGIIKMFWAGMVVELPKMRQFLRDSEEKQDLPIIYMEIRETREEIWSFKLLGVDWKVI